MKPDNCELTCANVTLCEDGCIGYEEKPFTQKQWIEKLDKYDAEVAEGE